MEVNIALLVIAVGLTSLMALFPVGLKESDTASADTLQTAAASYIFARMRENAEKAGNWSEAAIKAGFTTSPDTKDGRKIKKDSPKLTGLFGKDATGKDKEVRYHLVVGEVDDYVLDEKINGTTVREPQIYYAKLRVTDKKFGDFMREPLFYTEFVNKGEVQ